MLQTSELSGSTEGIQSEPTSPDRGVVGSDSSTARVELYLSRLLAIRASLADIVSSFIEQGTNEALRFASEIEAWIKEVEIELAYTLNEIDGETSSLTQTTRADFYSLVRELDSVTFTGLQEYLRKLFADTMKGEPSDFPQEDAIQ